MDLGIAGKTALVTASSKGLGRASAMALAQEGANVVISARTQEALDATTNDIESAGGSVLAVAADVTEPDSPRRLVEATVERFGALDILVANAGGPPQMRALEVDDAAVAKALNDNLQTSIRLVQESVPYMQGNKWGRIALITSSSIKQPITTLALSNMARTGLWAWAKTAARDLYPQGINLNTVCPGVHATDRMKQLGLSEGTPAGDPADFGRVVAFMCSQPANFISGAAILVDGSDYKGLY